MGCACCKSAGNSVIDEATAQKQLQDALGSNGGGKNNTFKVLTRKGIGHGWENELVGPDGVIAVKPAGGQGDYEEVSGDSAVKVAVMVRPMLGFETDKGATDVVSLLSKTKVKLPSKASGAGASDNGYTFDVDRVYRSDSNEAVKQLFAEAAAPVLERVVQGFNGTILAYGQTGAGKTYTMGTGCSARELSSADAAGLIPVLLHGLFKHIASVSKTYDCTLKVSYVEIYNEAIKDLLVGSPAASTGKGPAAKIPAALEVRDKPNGEVYIDGAVEGTAGNVKEVAALLEAGNSARAVASHNMNAQSSRSHAVVTLTLEQRAKPSALKSLPNDLRFLRSKLRLVDLAGSERQKDTGATGDRFAEGVSINKGLLELGNVINALTEGASRKHIPYRNSKLTRVLQDSLGGNSETLFIACVSPASTNHEQTLNTLRYASRARKIRNNLRLNNTLSLEEENEYLRQALAAMQEENAQLKSRLAVAGVLL